MTKTVPVLVLVRERDGGGGGGGEETDRGGERERQRQRETQRRRRLFNCPVAFTKVRQMVSNCTSAKCSEEQSYVYLEL